MACVSRSEGWRSLHVMTAFIIYLSNRIGDTKRKLCLSQGAIVVDSVSSSHEVYVQVRMQLDLELEYPRRGNS